MKGAEDDSHGRHHREPRNRRAGSLPQVGQRHRRRGRRDRHDLAPGGFVAAEHIHPYQSERFEILSGEVEFKRGKEIVVAKPGEVVIVEPGTPHHFRNLSDEEEIRFRAEVRPALSFETFLETMYGLAADGKTNKKGLPNPFRLAVIMNEQFDLVRLPFPPVWVQRTGLALGALLGRLLGYEPVYAPAEEPERLDEAA
jgi:mannose-6-phosphate isomerase-like protein (cupin superfamily)